jgi:hypothetical protein
MLESIDVDSYSSDDVPAKSCERITTAKFGHVTFGDFDATPYGIALP